MLRISEWNRTCVILIYRRMKFHLANPSEIKTTFLYVGIHFVLQAASTLRPLQLVN